VVQRVPATYRFAYLPSIVSRRPFLFVAAFLIAGIVCGESVWHGRLPMTAAIVVLAVLAGLVGMFVSKRPCTVATALLVLWLGVVVVNLSRARSVSDDSFSVLAPAGDTCRVEGTVLDEPRGVKRAGLFGMPGAWRYGFLLRVTAVELDGQRRPAGGTVVVRVSRKGELGLEYGDRVILAGTVTVPDCARNPGGFDYRAHLDREGIHRVLRVGMRDDVERLWGGGSLVWKAIYAVRERLGRTLDRGRMSDDSRTFLKAVLLGERRGISEELEDALVDTNTVHILAISGLHVAIIALAVHRGLKLCFLPEWLASVLTLLLLAVYAAMTGGRAPVVRAGIMMGVILLAPVLRREADILNGIAFAAVVILVARPLDLFSPGFQLSFVAATVITMLTPRMAEWATDRMHLNVEPGVDVPDWRQVVNPSLRACVQLLAVSVCAGIAVAPLTAFYFNRFAPLAFLPNVAVVALMGLIVPLGLFTVLTGQVFPAMAAGFNTINNIFIIALQKVIVLTSNVGPIHFNVRSAPVAVIVAYYAVLAATGFAHSTSRAVRCALAAALVVIGGLVVWSPAPVAPSGTEIVVLDVGKGEAIFVRTRQGQRILIDGGMVLGSDPGRWTIMPFLRSRGYNRLDTVVLTHHHSDHAGGLEYVIKHMPVGRLVVRGGPETRKAHVTEDLLRLAEQKGVPVVYVEAGERLTAPDDTPIVVLSPDNSMPGAVSENNASIVLGIGDGPGALLAADIEGQTERGLVATQPERLRAAVLKVPHQGSKYSSTPGFIETVRPAVAIITADRFQIHPHPAPETLERYESRGIRVLRTDHHGVITVLLTADGVRVWTALSEGPDGSASDQD